MFKYPKEYDVIVVGAGHAGVEASLAAARMGCQTLLLTINADSIGQMSCNPAIGGLAKGHLAREIDALGGEMGINTDMTGLQFRMLNTKKGPSVWAPRAQCDKKAYQFRLKWVCEKQDRLDIQQGQAMELVVQNGRAMGVQTNMGVEYGAKCVVVTTGTFLRGLMHIGSNQLAGGRAGEGAATGLSAALQKLGIELTRLKTGTPPRLLRRHINFKSLDIQHGDEPVPYFSFSTPSMFHVEHGEYPPGSILEKLKGQLPCYITSTTLATKEIIKENLHKSPMYSGVIEGIGPRYCPSIEDKVVKFSDKEKHQIFLEPEGIATDEFYVNGLSTCLPYDVQIKLVRSIIGCEQAEILRPAYAVEYDCANPIQLQATLESNLCENLFLAGQINGTSGYEEAAAQGIMAGINAARRAQGLASIVLRRDEAYIGVLIDDLVTKGTTEPYRMFTSRAEYRLLLRQDNADQRLSQKGFEIGLLPETQFQRFRDKMRAIDMETMRLEKTQVDGVSLLRLLKRPEVTYDNLPGQNKHVQEEVRQQVEIAVKYAGYVARQETEVARFRTLEEKQIPDWLDYNLIPSLRLEARQKLTRIRPRTLGQASRISGVSPSDMGLVMVWMKRGPDGSN